MITVEMIEKVIYQISKLKVETVNLGGNEPIFTNGINPKDSLLPYIITRLVEEGYKVGLHVRFCERLEVKSLLLTQLRGRELITHSYSLKKTA